MQTNAQWRALLEEWVKTDANISAQLADRHSWLVGKLRATYANAFRDWPDRMVYNKIVGAMDSDPPLELLYTKAEGAERVAISVGTWVPLDAPKQTLNVAAQPAATLRIPGMPSEAAPPSTSPQVTGVYRRGGFAPRGGQGIVSRVPQPLEPHAVTALLTNSPLGQQLLALHNAAPAPTTTALPGPAVAHKLSAGPGFYPMATAANAVPMAYRGRAPRERRNGGRWVNKGVCLRCGEDGHWASECNHRDVPGRPSRVSKFASAWIRYFNELPPRWVAFEEWTLTAEESRRLDAARQSVRHAPTDAQGRLAPYPAAAQGAPPAREQRVRGPHVASGSPLAATAPVPTLNMMSEQLVHLLEANGLAIVATPTAQPAEAQTQTAEYAGDAETAMTVDGGTGASQGA